MCIPAKKLLRVDARPAAVVVAANNSSDKNALSALMSAALALPVLAMPLKANALELSDLAGGAIGFRALDYREPSGRMHIHEPLVWLRLPVGEKWEVSGSRTIDTLSGASPIIVSNQTGKPVETLTGASIVDRRTAASGKILRRFDNATVSMSRTISYEKDYYSHAFAIDGTFDFNEKNTTLAWGFGKSNDRILSVSNLLLDEKRVSKEYLFGITQIIDRNSLIQSNVVVTKGQGYFNDPYKLTVTFFSDAPFKLSADLRPNQRNQFAWLSRYKRALPTTQAVLSAEYRFYRDDWGVRAHTIATSWLQTLNESWKIEAGLRYYSQSQANFYRAELPSGALPLMTSSDQRLASFGALEPSIKLIYSFGQGTSVDLSYANYQQRANWKFGGGGSYAFAPYRANLFSVGITHAF